MKATKITHKSRLKSVNDKTKQQKSSFPSLNIEMFHFSIFRLKQFALLNII